MARPRAAVPDPAVEALQRALLLRLRRGGAITTVHKEGGTTIRFDGRVYRRVDHGDWQADEHYASDEALLAFLRRFFASEWTHVGPPPGANPGPIDPTADRAHRARDPAQAEREAWRRILARVEPVRGDRPASAWQRLSPPARWSVVALAVVGVFVLIGTMVWWRGPGSGRG